MGVNFMDTETSKVDAQYTSSAPPKLQTLDDLYYITLAV